MKSGNNLFNCMIFSLLLIAPAASFANSDAAETIIKQGSIDDDYYAAGGSVIIDAEVNGDLVVAGGELTIGHHIEADLMAVGGSIIIRGIIQDDVRTAGGKINIDAKIGDDLMASGGDIEISPGSSIGGTARLAGGDLLMAGTVGKDLQIAAGKVKISGVVGGNVEIKAGEVELLEGARIEGNLHYTSPKEATIHSGATVSGDIRFDQAEWDESSGGESFFIALTLIVAAIIFFLAFPDYSLASVERLRTDPLASLGYGFLTFIVTPIIVVVMVSIIIGIWLGLALMAIYMLALLAGMLISCVFVGDWGGRVLNKNLSGKRNRLISIVLAIVVLTLLGQIPFIGGLMFFVLLLSGLGAGILQLRSVYRVAG